jgi:Holliday junction resolvasome RuvABC endonuclease subunit
MNVLGIDPGFSSLGWSVIKAGKVDIDPLVCGVIKTEKAMRKVQVRASEDNIQRAQQIYNELDDLINNRAIQLICTETMSWPRNAGVVAKMGIVWGVISSVACRYGLPIIQASPVDIKFEMTQDKKASKEKMIEWVKMFFPTLEFPKQTILHEHCADATAAVWACRRSQLFMAMRNANNSVHQG